MAAAGAYAIGNANTAGDFGTGMPGELGYVAAHAALGCAAGAAEGTGCGSGALGGAASAALSPDFLKAIDPTGAPLDMGQQAALAAFATLAGGGLAGLAGVNVSGAATAAQNEALNNSGQASHVADTVKGGGLFGSLLLTAYTVAPWLPGNPTAQAVGATASSVAQGLAGQIQSHNGPNPPSTGAAPVTVCDPPLCYMSASPAGPGGPSNVLLSKGSDNGESELKGNTGGSATGQGSATNSGGSAGAGGNVPTGYTQNSDGTVTGPKGGTYTPTGTSDAYGNPVYVGGNGNYYTLSSDGSTRVVSPNPPTGIGSTGQIGEDALKALGGQSQVTFPTTQGPRVVDQLAPGNVANEGKVGYVAYDAATALQVSKDAELLNTGAVNGVTWNFYRSPVTGQVGPSPTLSQALTNAGIKIVTH